MARWQIFTLSYSITVMSHEHHAISNHKQLDCCKADNSKEMNSSCYWPFVREIHQWLVKFPYKGPIMWKVFPCHDINMMWLCFQVAESGWQMSCGGWRLSFPPIRWPGRMPFPAMICLWRLKGHQKCGQIWLTGPLGDVVVISTVWFSHLLYIVVTWAFGMKLLMDECHSAWIMKSQDWFR